MNPLKISLAILTTSTALASTFKVSNPIVTRERIPVPISHIYCEKGPFKMSQLRVKLPIQLGNIGPDAILTSGFMGDLDYDECNAIILNLFKYSNGEVVDLETTLETRSVVKLTEPGSYKCEGAHQETVSMNVGGTTVRKSIFKRKGELSCPEGIYPHHVRTRDQVIYVLHEDGVPTKSDY